MNLLKKKETEVINHKILINIHTIQIFINFFKKLMSFLGTGVNVLKVNGLMKELI